MELFAEETLQTIELPFQETFYAFDTPDALYTLYLTEVPNAEPLFCGRVEYKDLHLPEEERVFDGLTVTGWIRHCIRLFNKEALVNSENTEYKLNDDRSLEIKGDFGLLTLWSDGNLKYERYQDL